MNTPLFGLLLKFFTSDGRQLAKRLSSIDIDTLSDGEVVRLWKDVRSSLARWLEAGGRYN